MAKKKKIVEEHKSEPVTNCDQSQEPVAKCDQLVKVDANGNHLDSGDIVLSQYDIEKLSAMRVKETKRQGRIAHHHTDATVPHIVALPGFSFHDAKISIILLISKFLSHFLPSSIIFLTTFIPSPTPHFIKLSRFCGITFAYSMP